MRRSQPQQISFPMTDNASSPLPYRSCVGIALFNEHGQVFVGERIDTKGAWQMPQGGIDRGENIKQAALRELAEEVGTNIVEFIRITLEPICYDLPPELQGKMWGGKYRGQEQIWVAMRFNGSDSDIKLDAFDPPEFSRWQWVDLKDTLDLIVPFKQEAYRKVITMFSDIAQDGMAH